jgi:RHS repeat-associated protein
MEGAGGIGGLLARSSGYSGTTGNWSTHNYYFADGNGNVTYLESSAQGLSAKYRYDPFGNTISSSGAQATANVYRFSSKELLANSGLYYYGYRFYDPSLQRWVNKDPMEEEGGINLYAYVINSPVNSIDPFGLVNKWPLNGIIESGLQDAAKKCGAKLSNAAAAALRQAMTEDEYKKLTDPSVSDAEKAAILKAIAERVQKDPKVDDKTKKNIKDAQDACSPPCPPKAGEGGGKTNQGGTK